VDHSTPFNCAVESLHSTAVPAANYGESAALKKCPSFFILSGLAWTILYHKYFPITDSFMTAKKGYYHDEFEY